MRDARRQLGPRAERRTRTRSGLIRAATFVLVAVAASCASRPNIVGYGGRTPVDLACFAPGAILVRVESERGEELAGVWVPPPVQRGEALVVLDLLPSGGALMLSEHRPRDVYAELHALGCAALAFDWRGVGDSDGACSSENVAADARAMWAEALRRAGGDPGRVVVRGTSLGSLGAAAILAAGAHPRAVIVVAPVLDETVVRRWADAHLSSWIGWSAQPFVRAPVEVDLCGALERAGCRALLALSGARDELLPEPDRARLRGAVERAGGTWLEFPDADHLAVGSASQALFAAERAFLDQLHGE